VALQDVNSHLIRWNHQLCSQETNSCSCRVGNHGW